MAADFKNKLKELKGLGKNIDTSRPLGEQKNVTLIEYVAILLARVGGMFGTTLTGTLAAAFLHELYFGPVGVDSNGIAQIMTVQTTLMTIAGIVMPLLAGIIVQKWKSRWGRYRQWYIICLIPIFVLTVSFFWVPKGWTVQQMALLRYAIAVLQTVFNAFNNLGQNITQVISPNFKEKKTIATIWQLAYYLGYGGAYLGTFVYGLFSDDKEAMYMRLAIVAAVVTLLGNLFCGIACKERIEMPRKEKIAVSKALFTLFKYRNYRAYQYMQWVNVLANLGKWSTYLAAITVGSSKNLLLTLPTAAGTVVGNVITAKISKKYEPTTLLKFCGIFSMCTATLLFVVCFIESKAGLIFYNGWNSVFFYIIYFMFGLGIGIQELSNSHFTVEYQDYLEWQTGERLEAIQGVVPGWVNSGLSYVKDLLIPFMLAWVAYPTADASGDLIKTIENRIASGEITRGDHLDTCLWILAFLVFGYAISTALRALILKLFYDIEGEKKQQMYRELEEIRRQRHEENEEISDGVNA